MNTESEKILSDLVAIRSITGDFAANETALDYVENYLSNLGMYTNRLSYNETIGGRKPHQYGALVCTTKSGKTPKIMLSAHIDVVPGPIELFELKQQPDKLYGRGVADMKGAIASFLDCANNLYKKHQLSDYDFGVTIVTNEEIGGKGVHNTLKDGYLPKAVVIPDNGRDWQIEKVSKGAWTIVVTAKGVSAHGSRPWEGVSATYRLLDFLAPLKQMFYSQSLETDTLNISILKAGNAQNQIPETASATLDIRVMSQESQKNIEQEINKLCEKYGLSYEEIAHFPPLVHDMDNEYIRKFIESIKAIRGFDSGHTISTGACDASYYEQYNIPSIVVRPTGGGEHSDDEWIDRKEFNQFSQVLEHFITNI